MPQEAAVSSGCPANPVYHPNLHLFILQHLDPCPIWNRQRRSDLRNIRILLSGITFCSSFVSVDRGRKIMLKSNFSDWNNDHIERQRIHNFLFALCVYCGRSTCRGKSGSSTSCEGFCGSFNDCNPCHDLCPDPLLRGLCPQYWANTLKNSVSCRPSSQ